jgi:hypothetical protein
MADEQRLVQRLGGGEQVTIDSDREVVDENGVTRKLFAGTKVPKSLAEAGDSEAAVEAVPVQSTTVGGDPPDAERVSTTIDAQVAQAEAKAKAAAERTGAKAETAPPKTKAERGPERDK